jgi:hypothetical protein
MAAKGLAVADAAAYTWVEENNNALTPSRTFKVTFMVNLLYGNPHPEGWGSGGWY